ncbi:NUDIX hydrolase [Thaumasiovibrio sp. DFM-14]|uniref:NUDIX hydrolase n=1 Tax=Thaumasiovibrio sp. DFM-14 TaxID=3384792 RepID=UPI0039A30B3D
MPILKTAIHPQVAGEQGRVFTRLATRAIVIRDDKILLLYTQRYDDYSLPGGGVDDGEQIEAGFIRELMEETGATGVKNITPLGVYEEYRPWHKPDFDTVHMLSYCFFCDIDDDLGETQLESYEIKNGMHPVWLTLQEAIAHNEATLANSEKKGLSVEREIFLLKEVIRVCSQVGKLSYVA